MALTVENVLGEWKLDNTLDEHHINREITRTPLLHSKYVEFYLQSKGKYSNSLAKYNRLKFKKRKYYRGEMTQDELLEMGWDQYQGLKMSQAEFNSMAEIDPDLIDINERVEYWKAMVQGLEYIIKQIQGRDWAIKTLVEHTKIINGG